MPLFTEDDLLAGTIKPLGRPTENLDPLVQEQPSEQSEGPSGFIEASRAFYQLEDPIFNIAKQFIGPEASEVDDPTFNPIDAIKAERPDLIPYADRFIDVTNREQFNKKSFNIDNELTQKKILEDTDGIPYVAAGLAAGVIDPITLVPLVKVAKTTSTAARIASGVASGAVLGATSAGIREGILQATTETRTQEQTLTNLIAVTAAGSIFGGGIAAVTKPGAYYAGEKLLENALDSKDIHFVVDTFEPDMVGRVEFLRAVDEEASKVEQLLGKDHIISSKAAVSLPGDTVIRIALDEQASKLAMKQGTEYVGNENIIANLSKEVAPELELPRSVGAAEVNFPLGMSPDEIEAVLKKEALGLAHMNETLAKVISGPEGLRPPDLRAILSPSTSVRKLGEVFYDSPFIRKKNQYGMAAGFRAENQIFRDHQVTIKVLDNVDELYTRYTGKGDLLSSFEFTRGADKINYREYSRRIYSRLVGGADDSIPEVNQAAALMRKEMDDTAAKLQKAGLLPEDLDPNLARNYMTRIYDLEKLRDPKIQDRFIDRVGKWISKYNKDGSPRTTALDIDDAELRAEEILDKIRGETDQAIALSSIAENFISRGKFLKERQLLIPDSEIQEFLMDDAIQGFKNYQSRTSKLLAAQNALKEAGFDSIQDVQRAIRSEAEEEISKLKDPKEISKIAKKFDKEEKLALMMYRSVLGQLKKPHWSDKMTRHALNYQYTRLLGNVTITSLSEIFMIPFRLGGYIKTFRDGYLPFLRDFNTARFSRDQLNDLTGALEMQQNGMLRSLSGLEDESLILRDVSSFDLISQAAAKGFSQASLIGYWTAFGSRMAAQVSAAGLIRKFKRGITPADYEDLASLGIDKSMYSRLTDQINKYTKQHKGTYLVNPAIWKDQEALAVFKNAIQTDANSAILKPGIGSQPFFVQQSNLGKLIWQFKSFMSAATSKILISSLQRRDTNVITGIMGLIASGGLITMIKDKIAGREVEYTPEMFIANGLSNSGLLGLLGTTALDTSRSFADPEKRRYLDQTVEGTLMGPTIGQIRSATKVIQRLSDGEITDKDWKATLRMVPFNNLFYINYLTNQIFNEE